MDFGISTRCFGNTPLTLDHLERLRRAEFQLIELHAAIPGLDYQNRSLVRGIARWFSGNDLPAPSLHLPFAENVLAARPVDRQRALDEIKRCLELGDSCPLSYAVLHLGAPGDEYNPSVFEHAYAAISTIQSFSGVRVLIETLANGIANFDRIAEFTAAAQIQNLGICYDTGHGEMEGTPDAIHLDDNNGAADDHLWPFEGSRDWPAFVERLVMKSFDGPLILEAQDDRLDKASSCRTRLSDLVDEALNSMDEFRLKHKLPEPRQEEDE